MPLITHYMQQNNTRTSFAVRLSAILISLLAIGFVLIKGKEIFMPLMFALIFSILLLPLARWIELKLHTGRGFGAGIAVLLFVACIVLIFYTVGSQISNLSSDWPQFKNQLQVSLNDLEHWISLRFHYNIEKQKNYINNAASKVLSGGTAVIGSTLVSVSSIVLLMVLTLIYTFFLLLYRKVLQKFLIALVNEKNSLIVSDVITSIQIVIRKYILGLLLEMLIVASLCWISFGILGIKYFILLGLITALFNIVPYRICTALLLSAIITFN